MNFKKATYVIHGRQDRWITKECTEDKNYCLVNDLHKKIKSDAFSSALRHPDSTEEGTSRAPSDNAFGAGSCFRRRFPIRKPDAWPGDSHSGGFQARAPSERRQFCDYRLEVDRLWRPSDKAE
jgi:hypothetical protein